MIYPDENHLLDRGNYEEMVNRHFATGQIVKYDEDNVRRFLSIDYLKEHLQNKDIAEYKYKRRAEAGVEEWCQATFTISERAEGAPKTAILAIRSVESLMREKEEQRHAILSETLTNLSEGFFVYNELDKEKILYASTQVLKLYGCDTIEEFREYTGGTFTGMVHPEDIKRVEYEISEQIKNSDQKLDYIKYRIIRKDGEVRWIDDCGHLESGCIDGNSNQFYVFISDITDTISESECEKLIKLSKQHNQA